MLLVLNDYNLIDQGNLIANGIVKLTAVFAPNTQPPIGAKAIHIAIGASDRELRIDQLPIVIQ